MAKKEYLYLVHFKARNVESLYNCHFLSKSKCLSIKNALCDNGRLVSCDELEIILTSVDFEIFERCYSSTIEFIDMKVSRGGYLNNTLRRFIVSLYKGKTTLKGVEGSEELYQSYKASINSVYGDMVTRTFSDSIVYDYSDKENIWHTEKLDDKTFSKKLKDLQKRQYKNYKAFIQGD